MASRTIKLHLGAHKTASTHIQATLELNRALMAHEGLAYWPLESFRHAFHELYEHERSLPNRGLKAYLPRVGQYGKYLRHRLWELLDIPYDILISEENLLGHPGQCLSGSFYQDAQARLELLSEFLGDAEIEVFLSIREYGAFLASCYGEALTQGSFCEVEDFIRLHRDGRRDWSRVVQAILTALPQATLYVWRYEDWSHVSARALEGMTGLSSDRLAEPPRGRTRPSASGKAIEETVKFAAPMSTQNRIIAFLAMQAKYPRSDHPNAFKPWPSDVAERLSDRYAAEVADLSQRSDLRFLHPQKT